MPDLLQRPKRICRQALEAMGVKPDAARRLVEVAAIAREIKEQMKEEHQQ